jgi:uncharacterized sulfatase
MKEKRILFVFSFLFIIFSACKKNDTPPNVVFILADDLGWSQTGCFGSSFYQTPNIDRLASEGVRFTNAYSAAAVCSPTRASIMTGKYPARLHITDFIAGNESDDYLLHQPDWQKFLPLEETTIAEIFKLKGYRTAMFGKWHLSREKFGPPSLPHYPDKQGFDDFFVIDKPDRNDDPETDPHKSDSIGNTSVRFLHENISNPFFLYVSFSAIHNPLMDSADSIARWKNTMGSDKPENNPVIAAMLSRMDRNIGKILTTLDELKLAKNTIVVFFSDNGGLASEATQTPLRSGKGCLYEGGIRVPMVIRWPGVIEKGKVIDEAVVSCDFLPSFCDLLGAEVPQNLDGITLLPILTNAGKLSERNIYWHYPHYHAGTGMTPAGAVRSGHWKLIEWYEKSLTGQNEKAFELYNLQNDLGEQFNLADSLPDLTLSLSGELKQWKEKLGAQMPEL